MSRAVAWVSAPLEADELTLAAQAKKYQVTEQQIAAANDVPYTSAAIYAWVKAVGGKQLPSGAWVFQPGNVILLPATVPGPSTPVLAASSVPGWVVVLGLGFLLVGGYYALQEK